MMCLFAHIFLQDAKLVQIFDIAPLFSQKKWFYGLKISFMLSFRSLVLEINLTFAHNYKGMADWKDFFAMTRRERRGTIVVLAVIAVLIAATLVLRNCRGEVPEQAARQTELLEFEHQADTTQLVAPSSKHKRHAGKKDKRPRKSKGGKQHKKSPASPRRVDPVPQF